jgi:hypothetical protein
MDVASRRRFRASAGQNSDLLKEAVKDKNHPYHSTAIHMKQEGALRENPKLLKQALSNPKHKLHAAAYRAAHRDNLVEHALANKNHKLHAAAHRVAAQDNVAGFNALPFAS